MRTVGRLTHICVVEAPAAPRFGLECVALDCMRQRAQVAKLLQVIHTVGHLPKWQTQLSSLHASAWLGAEQDDGGP